MLSAILVAFFVGTGEGFRNVSLVVAAILAFPVLIWRTKIGVQQADSADEGILNERFQTAAQMLGHHVLAVRTSGVQAFGVLASDATQKYHVQVLRLLCAFIRNPPKDEEIRPFEEGGSVRLREDVQAAVGVVGGRRDRLSIEQDAGYEPNLIDADLSGARLWGSCLVGAICIRSKFVEARLGNVDFANANLEFAEFNGAFFTGEGIDNPEAKDKPVTMVGANAAGADFTDADLTGVDISGVDFAYRRGRPTAARHVFARGVSEPAKGLTQAQLDKAVADPTNPPILDDVRDENNAPLHWRGALQE